MLLLLLLITERSLAFDSILSVSSKFRTKSRHSKLILRDLSSLDCISTLDFDIVKVGIQGGLAGGFRGLARLVTYPWDTMKTLDQADVTTANDGVPLSSDNLSGLDYFRGLWVTIVSAMPANAVFFIVYYYFERFVPCFVHNEYPFIQKLVVSLLATLPQNAIKIPAEVVKQRSQVQPQLNSVQIIKEIAADQGK